MKKHIAKHTLNVLEDLDSLTQYHLTEYDRENVGYTSYDLYTALQAQVQMLNDLAANLPTKWNKLFTMPRVCI